MMTPMANTRSLKARVKINLNLHVGAPIKIGDRAAYHPLQSWCAFPDIGDDIKVTKIDHGLCVDIVGPYAEELLSEPQEKNLAVRSFGKLQDYLHDHSECGQVDSGVHIEINKKMPLGSGMGAGTADAAAVMIAVRSLFNLNIDDEILQALMFEFAADGPLLIAAGLAKHRQSKFMSGFGEVIELGPDLPEKYISLINPGVHLSTVDIFRQFDHGQKFYPLNGFEHNLDYESRLKLSQNDLQPIAMSMAPELQDLQDFMVSQRPELVRMTGSGATMYAIFNTRAEAEHCAIAVKNNAAQLGLNAEKIWYAVSTW